MLAVLLGSCQSTNELIETGNYDRAIDKLVGKLAGKGKKSRERVVNLEFAFKKAQDRDLGLESTLLEDDDEIKWEKIYSIHNRIEERQRKVEPLIPLVAKDGYQARFQFINTAERKKESKANTASYYYKTAQSLLEEYRQTGHKESARSSYDLLVKIQNLYSNYKDVSLLMKTAKDYGTSHYLVRMVNNTNAVMPLRMEDELLNIAVTDLNRNWKIFDMRSKPGIQYDYHIIMNLTNLDFSPEREKIRIIEDQYEHTEDELITDKKGRPVLDSLGKKQYQKVIIKYPYTIEEIAQSKAAIIGGRLEWINQHTKNIEFSRPLNVEGVFDNRYGRLIKGDRTKMNEEGARLLKGRPLPFPSNEAMVLDAGEKLKHIVKDYIYDRER